MSNISRISLLQRIFVWLIILGFGCWFIRVDQIFFGEVEISALGIDSDQYLSAAGTILNLPVPFVGGVQQFESGLEIRTPGYPVLMTLPVYLAHRGFPLANSIAFFHGLLLVVTLVGVLRIQRGALSAELTVSALLIGALPMREYFFMLLAEWQAFCFLTLFLAAAARFYCTRTTSATFLMTTLASATTLTRPDYLVLFPFAALLLLIRSRFSVRQIAAFALGSLPVLSLFALNLYRFERLTLAPVEGHAFVLLSPFSSTEELEALVAQCDMPGINLPDIRRMPVDAAEMILLNPMQQIERGASNLISVTEAFHAAGYTEWGSINSCLIKISNLLARAHFRDYLKNYLSSLLTLTWIFPFLGLAWIWKKQGSTLDGRITVLLPLALAVHIIHIAFVSAVNVMHLRYYIVSFSPLLVFTILIWLSRASRPKALRPEVSINSSSL